jgi:DNA-binding LacI/PurR family transcriptional regulator
MSASDSPARAAASRGTSPRRLARVTSFDVAEAAGVSQSTVSRALAGDPSISAPTRERVTEAARRLNYQVDENAARLRRGKTGTLAVVMVCRPGQDRKDLNPFYYAMLGSTCAAASARGYEVLVSFQDSQANFWGHYQERRKADGMIVIGTSENTEAWDYFGKLPEGSHWVCWGATHDDFPWVRSDNHAGAALATRHMLVRGYRRIVCLGSETSPQRQFKERYDGYAAAMESAGLEPVLQRIERGLPREEQGRRATAALIDSGQPFDGLFGVSDEIALGALKELAMRGIAVPDQVGVVGFDGVRAGAWSTPPLTTVESDFEVAGSLLVDRLLGVIAGETTTARRVPVRMVVRGSTRP